MARQIVSGLLLLVILAASLGVQPASAAATQTVSGSVRVPVTLTSGNTVYVISYSYPASAVTGSNITVGFTFGVASFTGYKEYVQDYAISVVLPFGHGLTLNESVSEGYSVTNASTFVYLYPGSVFGPENVTFPLTPQDTGLKPGQEANVNVTIGFSDDVLYDNPVNYYYPEFGSATVGQLLVQNPAPPGLTWVPLALIGVGVALLGASFFMRPGKRTGP